MDAWKKELINKYREMKPEMGVLVVRNKQNKKWFLDVNSDLKSMFNRIRFQLKMGGHPNQELQKEWNAQGENNFAFEVIDRLEYSKDETKTDYRDELKTLKSMWLEKLTEESKVEFYKS